MKKKRTKKPPQKKIKKTSKTTSYFKPVFHAICTLAVIALANYLYWPPQDVLVQRDTTVNLNQQILINNVKPEIVLVGNSILDEAVDDRLFSNLVQTQTLKFTWGGSGSAIWYLFLKNIIITARHKPKTVAIFFRDQFLTEPSFRVTGDYKKTVDKYAGPHEPLLDRLAYLDRMNPLFYHLYRYWPLYQQKDQIKQKIQNTVRHQTAGLLLSLQPDQIDTAFDDIFDQENMNQQLLTQRQLQAEAVRDLEQFDFPQQINKSFLPSMIEMAQKNNIQLIFVRMKMRRDAENQPPPPTLPQYLNDLQAYLQNHNVTFIDFTDDSRITLNLYAVGDHLHNKSGTPIFTRLLADSFKPLLK